MPDATLSPEAVVQRQLDAYNAKDVDALVSIYADDVQQFEFPSTLLAAGSAQLRERFRTRFAEPNLHARLLHRIVSGNIVIDHEKITRTFPEGPGTLETTAIYEVEHGKIAKAWFIPGAKALSQNRSDPEITWRLAAPADAAILAPWNHQLIHDEGHRNPMNVAELEERMRGWLSADYQAAIFSASGSDVGYALFLREPTSIYLRQFFIARDRRRNGLGRACFAALRRDLWPKNVRLTVSVLTGNKPAIAFWHAVGCIDYSLTLELL